MAQEKPRIRVVAAVISRDGRYLITQRRPKATLPLLWEFPGGKVEPGETDEKALAREVHERLGVDVQVGREVRRVVHPYDTYVVELHVYECVLLSDRLQPLRVHDFRWVLPSELDQYQFPGADQHTVDQLLGFAK
jgi:8-oxo-dGTP diphosphatase